MLHTFFHGWRRRAGCVALVMACVVASSWVRSNTAQEVVWFRRKDIAYVMRHEFGVLRWQWDFMSESEPTIGFSSYNFTDTFHGSDGRKWQFSTLAIAAPHWALALPLTFLSIFLLIWKPRNRPDKPD
jgi:hypothetical protein